jgi:hypothetical protein
VREKERKRRERKRDKERKERERKKRERKKEKREGGRLKFRFKRRFCVFVYFRCQLRWMMSKAKRWHQHIFFLCRSRPSSS